MGLILCYLQQEYGLVALQGATDVSFSSYPVRIKLADVLLVFATVMLLGLLTTIYPARKARRAVLI
jgi:lipoprotein-releasing system permease protein